MSSEYPAPRLVRLRVAVGAASIIIALLSTAAFIAHARFRAASEADSRRSLLSEIPAIRALILENRTQAAALDALRRRFAANAERPVRVWIVRGVLTRPRFTGTDDRPPATLNYSSAEMLFRKRPDAPYCESFGPGRRSMACAVRFEPAGEDAMLLAASDESAEAARRRKSFDNGMIFAVAAGALISFLSGWLIARRVKG